jgi:hypothetical protein
MTLRRGFKAEANAHAATLRRELRIAAHSPLCPRRLAEYLDIPIIPLTALETFATSAVRYLVGNGRDCFSAVTVFVGRHGRKRVILHNDGHAPTRQNSDLAHELAHAVLCHPPTAPFDPDPIAEAEAQWLGPTLLVSEEAALHIVRQKMSPDAAAALYGVSEQLLQMRINVTGAHIRVQRLRGA